MSKTKQRRTPRVSKSERIMLNITSPVPVQEMVSTLLVSKNGAKVLSKRRLIPESRGTALFISAGREVPCRVAWQAAPGPDGQMETGLEILSASEFWGAAEPGPAEPGAARAPTAAPNTMPDVPRGTSPVAAAAPLSPLELLEKFRRESDPESFSVELWSGLVDALEAKGVFTRDELIGMLRKLGRG